MDDTYAHLVRIVLPLQIVIGAFGNTLNLLIFTRKALRRNSCTQYFIVGSLNNLVVVIFIFVVAMLIDGYGMSFTAYSSVICKVNCYLSYLLYNTSPYLLILATFDRFCCSSPSATIRAWANIKIARRIMSVMFIIFIVIYTPLLVMYDRTNTNPPQCVSVSQTFSTILSFFQLFFFSLIPPLLMTVFGLLTLWNIRTRRQLIQPIVGTITMNAGGEQAPRRRSDNALRRMLTFQVFAYIICNTMLCVMVIMINIVSQPTLLIVTLLRIAFLPFYLSYCTSFYIYTLSAQLYRQEIAAIFNQIRRRIRNMIAAEH